jgi:hypothetical protein
MAFKKPDSLADLSIEELAALNDEALAEGRALTADPDKMSDEDIAAAEALMAASAEIETEIETREQAATDRAERIAALQAGLADAPADDTDGGDTDGDDSTDDGDGDAEEDDNADAAADKEKEPVVASANRTVGRARRQAREEVVVVEEPKPNFNIIAAANVPGYAAQAELGTMLETAKAFESRSRGFVQGRAGRGTPKAQVMEREVFSPHGKGAVVREFELSDRHQRFGVAQIERAEQEFVITERMSAQDQYDVMIAASKAARLGGMDFSTGLVAAGGWCAPSEIIYGFLELETVSGILDIPTVTARRGGIQFTKGPDYSTLAATWGFLQTEAQAEAGTAKTCYELECPTWDEVRLDAIGFCVTAPVLTNAAFPELTNRVLQIGATAHAHKVNASVISRISTYIGAAINWAEVGGSTSDILDAAALQAQRLRYQYAMAPNTVIEAVFPVWAIDAVRADVGRRLNIDNPLNVTDQAVNAWFAVRNIRVQWVYDYQPLIAGPVGTGAGTGTWTSFPTVLEFMMWPAGAFTKLTKDVIDLDTIYDSVGLGTNVYTAAFFEEGLAVANTGASGVKVQVTINSQGATGFPAVGAGSGVTFASA